MFIKKYLSFCERLYTPKSTESRAQFSKSATDQWILSRLAHAVSETHEGFSTYNFPQATTGLHQFWLYDLCDVYLEAIKPVFREGSPEAQDAAKETLFTCLENGLRLLAPVMPFLSEELWQRLPKRGDEKPSVHVSEYPKNSDWAGFRNSGGIDEQLESAMNCVKTIRSLRADYGLTPKQNPEVFIKSADAEVLKKFEVMRRVDLFFKFIFT